MSNKNMFLYILFSTFNDLKTDFSQSLSVGLGQQCIIQQRCDSFNVPIIFNKLRHLKLTVV